VLRFKRMPDTNKSILKTLDTVDLSHGYHSLGLGGLNMG
jgi:hypothetical protein